MTTKTIDVYFDLGSTNSYFAIKLLLPLAEQHQAKINWHAFNLGHVFKQNQYVLMDEPKAKMRNRKADLMRWANKYDLPFRIPDNFPIKTSNALKACIVMAEFDLQQRFILAVFSAYWEQNQGDIGDLSRLAKIASEVALNHKQFTAEKFLTRCQSTEVRQSLIDSTKQAQLRGVFGAPTIVIDDTIYWGKDRMDFIEDHLKGQSW